MQTPFRFRQSLLFLLTAGLLCSAHSAVAQTSTGTVRGFVRGPAGEPLVGANVVATQIGTNIQRGTITQQNGFFNLAGLQPGNYEIRATMLGHREQIEEVRLMVGQTLTLDFGLVTEALALEGVVVRADRVVEMRTQEIATNITQEQIENVPINDRNFLSLALLAPGVRTAGGSITSGGQSANNINVFVDGVSFKNDMLVGGVVGQDASQGNPFPQAAVQEFRVISQLYKAEYQKATSTVVTATTRSGTNEWEGEGFLFGQNSNVVARDFIAARTCSDSLSLNPNYSCPDLARRDKLQGGLSLGGPIMRDRLFFFGTYEGNHINWGATVTPQHLDVLAAMRPDIAAELATHSGTFDRPLRSNLYFGKLTYVPSVGSPHRVELSTSIRDEYDIRDFGGLAAREAAVRMQNDVSTFALRHQYARASWLNELGGSFQRYRWNPHPDSDLPNANQWQVNGLGVLNTGSRCCMQNFVQDRLSFRNDLTYTLPSLLGDHVFKFGGNFDFVTYDVMQTNNIRPTQRWDSRNDYAFPHEVLAGFGTPGVVIHNQQIGLYAQDDWNVSSRLTLNLGVRWDVETNENNVNHVTAPSDVAALRAFVPTLPCGEQSDDPRVRARQALCDLDHYITDGSDRSPFLGAIQPRLGFSYDLFDNQRTVLFGGAGVYYDRHRLGSFISEINRLRFQQYTFRFSTDGAPIGSNPTIVWDDSYRTREGLATILENAAIAPGGELHLYANDVRPPRTNQFSLGVRQSVGDYLFTTNYTGVRGYDFITMMRANRNPDGTCCQQNNPIWSSMFVSTNAGRTWYDALMFKAEKRFTDQSRWGWQVAYTLARAEENTNPGDRFTNLNAFTPDDLVRYPSADDERHQLTVNWTVGLPFDLRFGGLLDLGSGTPRNPTIGYGDGTHPCTHGNRDCLTGTDYPEGMGRNWWRPEGQTFILPNFWVSRNVDLRLERRFTTFPGQQIGVVAELFNVFDFANFTGYNLSYGSYQIRDGEVVLERTMICPVATTPGAACPEEMVPSLGRPTGVVTDLRRFGAPRRFQLGMRYTF